MGQHILVVDDEPFIRELLRDILEIQGYHIEFAVDGIEALDCVARRRPGLVVMDMRMPRLDGTALATRLRAQDGALPVLVVSASHEAEGLVQTLGASEFVRKPFEMDTLLAAVERLLKGHR